MNIQPASSSLHLIAWLALALAGACAAVASVLLKNAASLHVTLLDIRALALNAGAIVVYGVGFVLYGYTLRSIQVGTAYICMVAIAATLLFTYSFYQGEAIHARQWIGAVIIVLGVYLVAGHSK